MKVVDDILYDIDGMTIKQLRKYLKQFEDTDEIDFDYTYDYGCDERQTVLNVIRRD